jgi:hypothetical protein
MQFGPFTTLDELPNGAIFEMNDPRYEEPIRAVKSEYNYPNGAPQCVLLASGEYAHFPAGGETRARELVLPDQTARDCRTCAHWSPMSEKYQDDGRTSDARSMRRNRERHRC